MSLDRPSDPDNLDDKDLEVCHMGEFNAVTELRAGPISKSFKFASLDQKPGGNHTSCSPQRLERSLGDRRRLVQCFIVTAWLM